jgi:CDP-glycerol glycerophosphotransferase (TagB/SpsB family)
MRARRMKRLLLVLIAPVTALLYWLGGFIARRRDRWIFGSYSNAFNDNSKHLYIHVVEKHPEIEAIWITGDPTVRDHIRAAGGKAFLRWSLEGIVACLTGRYWFFSMYVADINYFCSRKATLVNLWHGIPLKKIEFDIEHGPIADRFQRPSWTDRYLYWPSIFKRPDYVLSTSARVTRESFASAFRIEPFQCINAGYPRNDAFFKSQVERQSSLTRWDPPATSMLIDKMSGYCRCLIYMPTWRDTNPNFILSSGWDFLALNEALKQQNMLLLIKLHVATPQGVLQKAANLSHIHLMQSTEDAYSVLPLTSALITDYSSILFDYLLLDKPIYYYPFDRKDYESDSRGFYHAYDSCTAGRCIKSPMELADPCLADDAITYAAARRALRESFFEHADAQASERIAQKFLMS